MTKDSGGIFSQSHYIEKVLNKFNHLNTKEVNTQFDQSIMLIKKNGRIVAQLEYACVISSLMCAIQCTRLDIAFEISKPSNEDWTTIGRVLGYLKKTKNLGLQYSKFPLSWKDTQMLVRYRV